mmetsp:Transcript_27713/g.63831  ORF Transcript_27713/g.63831 Transcript_27713/m.63831 type:complete len:223 (+) Transcript_27713:915-1583(+)
MKPTAAHLGGRRTRISIGSSSTGSGRTGTSGTPSSASKLRFSWAMDLPPGMIARIKGSRRNSRNARTQAASWQLSVWRALTRTVMRASTEKTGTKNRHPSQRTPTALDCRVATSPTSPTRSGLMHSRQTLRPTADRRNSIQRMSGSAITNDARLQSARHHHQAAALSSVKSNTPKNQITPTVAAPTLRRCDNPMCITTYATTTRLKPANNVQIRSAKKRAAL